VREPSLAQGEGWRADVCSHFVLDNYPKLSYKVA